MKTAAQLLKLKVVQNQHVHSIAPDQMVKEAIVEQVDLIRQLEYYIRWH